MSIQFHPCFPHLLYNVYQPASAELFFP
jgi:hypothetical protein